VPKRHTMSEGTKIPFRRELKASVPLELTDVLDFSRRELGKLNWKEESNGAVVTAEKATIAYASPDGPAILKLGRKDDATSITLVVNDPGAVAKLASRRSEVRRRFCLETSTTLLLRLRSTAKRLTSAPVLVSKIRTAQRSIYRPANTNIPSSSRASRCRAMRLNSPSTKFGADDRSRRCAGTASLLIRQPNRDRWAPGTAIPHYLLMSKHRTQLKAGYTQGNIDGDRTLK
jgi:hypothetical protein